LRCGAGQRSCQANPDGDGGSPDLADPGASPVTLGTSEGEYCNEYTIVQCFYNRDRLPIGTYNLTEEQLWQLMLAFYYDTRNRPVTQENYDLRAILDGPTWDGADPANGIPPETSSVICTDGKCYKGTEVNYALQGMISVKYDGPVTGHAIVFGWKLIKYGKLPSPGTVKWFNAGYHFYEDMAAQDYSCALIGACT